MSTETIDLKTRLITDFHARESVMNGEASSAFHQKKRAALAQFDKLGFPTPRNEEWKYSNVKDLISVNYNFNADSALGLPSWRISTFPSRKPILFILSTAIIIQPCPD
jgi:Fe-S cluster assembly protein SufD